MTGGTVQAIETTYAGCLFRSRLEARWAAMFDLLGLPWVYESVDHFLVRGSDPFYVEVKPAKHAKDYLEESGTLDVKAPADTTDLPLMLVGVAPLVSSIDDIPVDGKIYEIAGVIRTYEEWFVAYWVDCNTCNRIAVYNEDKEICHPCGHTSGSLAEQRPLEHLWNNAHCLTRWVPSRSKPVGRRGVIARFPSICVECDKPIARGRDEITQLDTGRWIHALCERFIA